ncbi:CidA/LrgA family protein [Oscillospiraceae bacterium PP1C4]
MKIMTQIGVLFAVCLAGTGISALLPFPFPASVAAMILLLIFLLYGLVKPAQVEELCDFLLKNMIILFIPAGVGLLENLSVLGAYLLPLFVVCLITTVLTFAVTAFTVSGVIWLQEKRKGGEHSA